MPGGTGGARAKPAGRDDLHGLNPRTASILCYAPWLGWIMAIVVLASQRFRQDTATRFHAFQGLYLFAIHFMVNAFLPQILDFSRATRTVSNMVDLALTGVGILLMVKTAHGEVLRLPVIGELAEKSVAEQK
jgi:uncharacterized membrane protein